MIETIKLLFFGYIDLLFQGIY